MGDIIIAWGPDDIVSVAEEQGMDITTEQAEAWLDRNGIQIRDRSIQLGWEVIETLLSVDDPTKRVKHGS